MKTFNFYLDRKVSVYNREFYTINANSEKEALKKCLNGETEPYEVECLAETEEQLPPEGNYPSIEVINSKTNKSIYNNLK
jgi:hypothetical protein